MQFAQIRQWLKCDAERRVTAARARVIWEGIWNKRGNRKRGALDGPLGQLFRSHIEQIHASGPKPIVAAENGQSVRDDYGYGLTWAVLCAHADLTWIPTHDAERQLSLVYRVPVQVGGDILSPAWDFVRARSGLDSAFRLRQSMTIAIGSCAIRPSLTTDRWGRYFPVGVDVIPPDRCFAIPDPANFGQAVVFGEQVDKGWQIWDLTNPANPRWGEWRDPQRWVDGYPAEWEMSGDDYPWRWQGTPIMPVQCHQFSRTSAELLPVPPENVETTLELLRDRAWLRWVTHAASFRTNVVLSDSEADGIDQAMMNPSTWRNIHGGGSKQFVQADDGLQGALALAELHRGRYQEWAQRFDPSMSVRNSEAAKSGLALSLELTGKYLLRDQMVMAARPLDEALIRALCAAHNALVMRGQIPLSTINGVVSYTPTTPIQPMQSQLVPEGDISIAYPHYWHPTEKADRRAVLAESVESHLESPRALWLFDRDLEDDRPDGPNWVQAGEALTANLDDSLALAQRGYGQDWRDLRDITSRTPEDEAAMWIPSEATARTASDGLRLRDDSHRGPSGGVGDNGGRRLVMRSKRLSNQNPFTMSDARILLSWLEAHESDADPPEDANDADMPAEEGEWGNDADPSSAYVTWLMQGGDSALAELRALLRPVEATDGTI